MQKLVKIYNDVTQFLENNIKLLRETYDVQIKQNEKVEKSLTELENIILQKFGEFTDAIDDKTDKIRKENKEFYKDLESTIRIKLEEHKSEIKQLIESERNQIKDIFEIELSKKTLELKGFVEKNVKDARQYIEDELNIKASYLSGGQNRIFITIWILGGLTLVAVGFIIVKQFIM